MSNSHQIEQLCVRRTVRKGQIDYEESMSGYRIAGNASSRLPEAAVTHGMGGRSTEGVRVCAGCGKQFRPKRPWQKWPALEKLHQL